MSASTATFTINNFPTGHDRHLDKTAILGTVAISAGYYTANGIQNKYTNIANEGAGGTFLAGSVGVYDTNTLPFFGTLYSPTSGINYQFDPTNQTCRIFMPAPAPPSGVLPAAMAVGAGLGSVTPTLSANSNAEAFSVSIASTGSGSYTTNTVTYTFAEPLGGIPVAVVSRGFDAAVQTNAGYWFSTDASAAATGLIFALDGTAATATYVLDGIVVDVTQNPSPAVATSNFAVTSSWGTSPTLALGIAGSTQTAFSLSITAKATVGTAPFGVTLTFPVPFATAPVFICSSGVKDPTVGHWAFTASTTTTASFVWVGTPTANDVYVLDAITLTPTAPAITSAAFALGAGFGTTASVTSVTGNELAFTATIAVSGSSIAANPVVTVTLPTALQGIPIWVVCRGDSDANTGFWASKDSSNTASALLVSFIGTPVSGHSYTLVAMAALPSSAPQELAVGATVPASVVADTIFGSFLKTYS